MKALAFSSLRRHFSPIRSIRAGLDALAPRPRSHASSFPGTGGPAVTPRRPSLVAAERHRDRPRPSRAGIVGTSGMVLLVAVLAIGIAPALFAQAPYNRTPPHIGFVYPAGGQQGTTIRVSVGGQNLEGTRDAFFTGAGLAARVVGFERPLTIKEFNDLRDKMQLLLEKRAASLGKAPPTREGKKGRSEKKVERTVPAPDAPRPKWTAADEQQLAEIRTKMARRPNRQGNPALAETVTLEVVIAPDASPGTYELRVKSPAGVSNPMAVQVGQLPEFTSPVVTSTSNPVFRRRRDPGQQPTPAPSAVAEVTIPTVVNGQILPGEVDRYRFAAKKGQHLTMAVSARSLIPYLADAVPGWFQATLALYDPHGHEVAYSDSFRFSPDPVVNYEIPADGMYALEVKDSIYRGREDFVYRVAIGELPFVTSLFPLGGKLAATARFQLTGWNLPATELTMDTKDKAPGQFLLSVRNRGQLSNPVRFALDAEASTPEIEPDGDVSTAQRLTLPVVVDGRIEQPGDEDVFRFEGKAGDEIVAEVFARRLGSPLDSLLKLTDASGRQLAENDDHEDKGVGLMTHHADSRLSQKLPADGVYYLRLADTQHHGGPAYGYRLRVGPPRPDFELRVTPSAVNLRPGAHVPITVYALRRDGFNGDIVLSLEDAPRGFWLAGALIPAGQDKVQLTLAAPGLDGDDMVRLTMVGAAMINGQPVGHVAVPAEDMMQAFAYHHLVPAKEWVVNVVGRPGPICRLVSRPPLQLPAGGTARLTIGATNARVFSKISVDLDDPPDGVAVKSTTVRTSLPAFRTRRGGGGGVDEIDVEISCDPAKVKAGRKGNLILNVFGSRSGGNAKGPARTQRVPLGSVPAIPYEVIAGPVASK